MSYNTAHLAVNSLHRFHPKALDPKTQIVFGTKYGLESIAREIFLFVWMCKLAVTVTLSDIAVRWIPLARPTKCGCFLYAASIWHAVLFDSGIAVR